MLNEEFLNEFFEKRLEKIEENISKEYHRRIGEIGNKNSDEKNNIKMSIISELYYKQGLIDGINFMIKNFKKNS